MKWMNWMIKLKNPYAQTALFDEHYWIMCDDDPEIVEYLLTVEIGLEYFPCHFAILIHWNGFLTEC